MALQWDCPKDLSRPCRFVALLDVLAAVLMKRCFIVVVAQETGFAEIEKGLDCVRGTARQIFLSKDSFSAEFVRLHSAKYQGSVRLVYDEHACSHDRGGSHGGQKDYKLETKPCNATCFSRIYVRRQEQCDFVVLR